MRAWQALAGFEGRSSLRSWLYSIATNVCLRMIERRSPRTRPIDYGPASDPHGQLGPPLIESTWIEPYPDAELGVDERLAGPEARYAQREAIELAFIAAVQHLPARQRAALILRDVLGFSGAEVAQALGTSAASVYSLLQRAHATLDERLPERSQQATLRSLGDDAAQRDVEPLCRGVGAVAMSVRWFELLTDTATLAMPPTASWFHGRDAIAMFLGAGALDGTRRWRRLPTSANGQVAMGAYLLDSAGAYRPDGMTVLSLDGDRVDEINTFRDHSAPVRFGLPPQA